MPNVLKELKIYGELLNNKIILPNLRPIYLPNPLETQLKLHFAFQWQVRKIKYLGVYIPQDLNHIYMYTNQ
ncbi:hypothetical protein XENTR_v10008698 [Xenopus tropicalis]|nr:hypothetical protein XENTR_v10008698 [Xenopus tropicalis]